MTPERWQQIEKLCYEALELDSERREAFLNHICASDEELGTEVKSMLAAHDRAGDFLQQNAMELEAEALALEKTLALPVQEFSHYRIISRIGAGGMGEVWLARDSKLDRNIALKFLPAPFTSDKDRLQRFVREAKAASALNHPNIITIHEIGEAETAEGKIHFIATEFIEGQTLRQVMAKEELILKKSLDIAIQIAEALAAAHEAGIIHRDIKPENLMIRWDGYVKVLDFGLAKLVESRPAAINTKAPTIAKEDTETGVVLGTATYMSPEQARGQKVDARTDSFSLGVVLYEMLAGHRPFTGGTTIDVLAAILNQEPPLLTPPALAEAAPHGEAQRIISKALRKKPDERYQTVRDLLVDLKTLKQEIEFQEKLERSKPSDARRPQAVSRSAAKPVESAGTTTASPNSGLASARSSVKIILGEVKQHRMGVAVMLTLFAVGLAASGYGLWHWLSLNQQTKTFQDLKFSRLTSTGNVIGNPAPAISPNGQFVAYVVEEGNQQSLWMKQTATGSLVSLVPAAEVVYDGQTFSPDNDYIYYAVGDGKTSSVLYRVPTVGGPSVRILEGIDTALSFSPKGDQFTFVGDLYRTLKIVGADAKESRVVSTRQEDNVLTYPAWSPDGKTIVCASPSAKTGDTGLLAVNVTDGTERLIGSRKWRIISGIGWLRDGSGLVITAAEKGSRSHQVWTVSFPDGVAHRMSNDLSNYFGVSLTPDATRLVSARQESLINLWHVPEGNADRARQITPENGASDGLLGIAWTPDGRIVYSSRSVSGADLWIVDANGSNRKQLTFNAGQNYFPTVSADGRYIVFVSDRAGTPSLWQMGLDGGNLKRLTDDSGIALKPECALDGSRIIYEFTRSKQIRLWQLPIDGGAPTQLTEITAQLPTVSPDGKLIACSYGEGIPASSVRLAILPAAGGTPLQLLNLPAVIRSPVFRWLPDGRGLVYLDSKDKVSNLWSQNLAGGQPKQLTDFKTDRIFYFALSRDGKQLACARGREISDLVLISNFQ